MRSNALAAAFAGQFGVPQRLRSSRAPGRVNLIGDHTDYNGLPVFPMALQREVRVAFAPREDTEVRIANVDPHFEPSSFRIASVIEPDPAGSWANYVKAAAQALAGEFGLRRGMDAMVLGDIPPGAGLSSSSALVVASALALLDAGAVTVDPHRLMELLARAERYVGTEGGGMDQAVSLGARRHSACRIAFGPLRLDLCPVPASWRFIVAFSLVPAEKSAAVKDQYNARARECREALETWCRLRGVSSTETSYTSLATTWSADRVVEESRVLPAPLRNRFRHVLREGARVDAAWRAMSNGDAEAFGALMSDSHRSLRDDFEVSHPALDELVALTLEHGACGARLTGAGFGGSAVALCDERRVEEIQAALRRDFYAPRGVVERIADVMFVAHPSDGANVEDV